jgi:hypothetical protein
MVAPLLTMAATVWTGPLITFTQANPYPGDGDRDQLTPNVALTRATPVGGGTGGMFNAVTESSFTKFVSPTNTEWAVGSLADYATLTYSDWTTCGLGNPVHNLPGEQLVVHLITDDIYLSLEFTDLPAGPGFTYIRSTPAPPSVTITNASMTAQGFQFSFSIVPGYTYTAQQTTLLNPTNAWVNLTSTNGVGSPTTVTVTDTNRNAISFYRVLVQSTP